MSPSPVGCSINRCMGSTPCAWPLRVVDDGRHPDQARAVRRAEDGPVGLDAVTNDPAATVTADRRQLVDRALEAIEHVSVAGREDLEREVVVVSADFTLRYGVLLKRAVRFVAARSE